MTTQTWRVVYDADNNKVIEVLATGGQTSSSHSIADFSTAIDAYLFIASSGLILPDSLKVPQEITMRQCRLHLHNIGKLGLVPAAIASLPEPPRLAVEIEWEYSSTVSRNKPFVLLLAPALGWNTPSEIDAQFLAASLL